MSQISIPVEVSFEELKRKATLGSSITLCADVAGLVPKQITEELRLDKAQWSRWESGAEGVIWPKFEALMDLCGNNAPLLWMIHKRGYDLHSLRKVETATEMRARKAEEASRAKDSVIADLIAENVALKMKRSA